MQRLFGLIAVLLLVPILPAQEKADPPPPKGGKLVPGTKPEEAAALHAKVVEAARKQIGVTKSYDPNYSKMPYPNGDVPLETGVCTDVIVRAFRAAGVDFQQLIHEDMKVVFPRYPQLWGLKGPDTNIDHRRVPNLMMFFRRMGKSLRSTRTPEHYPPGDIVVWKLTNGLLHIGLVSDKKSAAGTPLVIHNIGAGTQEEDILFEYDLIAHYRWWQDKSVLFPVAPPMPTPAAVAAPASSPAPSASPTPAK